MRLVTWDLGKVERGRLGNQHCRNMKVNADVDKHALTCPYMEKRINIAITQKLATKQFSEKNEPKSSIDQTNSPPPVVKVEKVY